MSIRREEGKEWEMNERSNRQTRCSNRTLLIRSDADRIPFVERESTVQYYLIQVTCHIQSLDWQMQHSIPLLFDHTSVTSRFMLHETDWILDTGGRSRSLLRPEYSRTDGAWVETLIFLLHSSLATILLYTSSSCPHAFVHPMHANLLVSMSVSVSPSPCFA